MRGQYGYFMEENPPEGVMQAPCLLLKNTGCRLSIFASLGLTITKFTAGLATGSLGILSEAIHSLIDLGATIITWFAVRWSDQPPDDEHHYGHAKAESVAALVETGLLFLTTAWIVFEAVKRLLSGQQHIDVTWWAVVIIGGSILVDFGRARALNKGARDVKRGP